MFKTNKNLEPRSKPTGRCFEMAFFDNPPHGFLLYLKLKKCIKKKPEFLRNRIEVAEGKSAC